MMRRRLLAALFVVVLTLCGCENRKQKPDSTKGRVTGIVLCADTGKPARFSVVTLIAVPSRDTTLEQGDPFASVGSTRTDLDGRFVLEAVPPGQYYATATIDGYQDPERGLDLTRLEAKANDAERAADAIAQWKEYLVPVKVSVHRTSEISIIIERASEIGGTVLYDDGSPAIGAHFVLSRKSQGGSWSNIGVSLLSAWQLPSVSDSHGRFTVSGIPAGEYRVCALLPTASQDNTLYVCLGNVLRPKDSSSVKVAAGEQLSSLEIVVPLSGLRTVSGSVTAATDGHAILHGTVQLLYTDDRESMRTASLDQDGQFSFEFVPEGTYLLRVSGANDARADESGGTNSAVSISLYGDKEFPLQVSGDIDNADAVLNRAPHKPRP